jgi:acylphosphatase
MPVCKRVIFSGDVQGVGFRYTTHRIARGYDVAGYVRNLPDESVELVAEGEPGEVGRFLDAVSARMADYIQGRTTYDEPPGGFEDFVIRH